MRTKERGSANKASSQQQQLTKNKKVIFFFLLDRILVNKLLIQSRIEEKKNIHIQRSKTCVQNKTRKRNKNIVKKNCAIYWN